jgi:hypothetical protein
MRRRDAIFGSASLTFLVVAVASARMVGGAAMAQPDAQDLPLSLPPVTDLEARLGALTPERPVAYFELGEEVADEAVDPEDVALARQLLVLAYELDRVPGSKGALGPSICLALARIERLDEVRDWLRATAGTLDPRYASTDWNVAAQPRASDQTALKAAEVLGRARAGEGPEALAALDQPGVRELLIKYEPLLGIAGQSGGFHRVEMQIRAWPCPECRNRRSVTRVERDGPVVKVCGTCNGNPGPELDQDELIAHLRFESRLLSGVQRSWSAQVASDYGAPLLDPDPEQLAGTLRSRYGVVLGRPYWRDGQWSERPDSAPVDAAPAPPATVSPAADEPDGADGH